MTGRRRGALALRPARPAHASPVRVRWPAKGVVMRKFFLIAAACCDPLRRGGACAGGDRPAASRPTTPRVHHGHRQVQRRRRRRPSLRLTQDNAMIVDEFGPHIWTGLGIAEALARRLRRRREGTNGITERKRGLWPAASGDERRQDGLCRPADGPTASSRTARRWPTPGSMTFVMVHGRRTAGKSPAGPIRRRPPHRRRYQAAG